MLKNFPIGLNAKNDVLAYGRPVEGKFAAGVATDPKKQATRIRILTEVYNADQNKYLEGVVGNDSSSTIEFPFTGEEIVNMNREEFTKALPIGAINDLNEGDGVVVTTNEGYKMYIDKYQWQSIPIVVETSSGDIIASARLILGTEDTPLPTIEAALKFYKHIAQFGVSIEDLRGLDPANNYKQAAEYLERKGVDLNEISGVLIAPEHLTAAMGVPVEFSQFAKADLKLGEQVKISHALLRVAANISREIGVNDWLATTDRRIMRMLNGLMHLGIPQIGPEINYLGSKSIPGHVNIAKSIAYAAHHDQEILAQFLNGETNIPEYSWYIGV